MILTGCNAFVLAVVALTATAALAQDGNPPPSRGRALLVGVSDYPMLKEELTAAGQGDRYEQRVRLRGPAHDVVRIEAVLIDTLQVPSENISKLVGWPTDEKLRPTRANIASALHAMAEDVAEGELVVVYLSGHGDQVPDVDGDETDGLDEVFLPADVSRWEPKSNAIPNAIVDDELGRWLVAIAAKGARVWLIVDACHSGTMLRGAGDDVRERSLGCEVLGTPEPNEVRAYSEPESSLLDGHSNRIVAMYAAAPSQKAIERLMPDYTGEYHGVFTWFLTQQLTLVGAGASFSELHQHVRAAYSAAGIHHVAPMGSDGLDTTIVAGAPSGPTLLVGRDGDELVVDAGSILGMRAGDVLEVYQRGRRGEKEASLGRVELVEARPTRSTLRVTKERGLDIRKLDDAGNLRLPALVSRTTLEAKRVRISLRGPDGHPLPLGAIPKILSDTITKSPGFARRAVLVEPAEAECFLRLESDVGGSGRLDQADGGESASLAFGPNGFAETLHRYRRARTLRNLSVDPIIGGLPPGLQVVLQVSATEEGSWRDVGAGEIVRPGVAVRVEIRAGPDLSPLDLYVRYLDRALEPSRVFPSQDGSALIDGRTRKIVTRNFYITDTTLGSEALIVLAVPPGSPRMESLFAALGKESENSADRGSTIGGVLSDLALGVEGEERMRDIERDEEADAARVRVTPFEVAWRSGAPARFTGGVFAGTTEDLVLPEPDFDGAPFRAVVDTEDSRGEGDASARWAPAVFVVRTRAGYGTGFLIDRERGLILTNYHVVAAGWRFSDRGRWLARILRGGRDEAGVMRIVDDDSEAEVVQVDEHRDLALLQVVGDRGWLRGHPVIPIGNANPALGADCAIIGNPSSDTLWSFRDGRVRSFGGLPHDLVEGAAAVHGLNDGERAAMTARLAGRDPIELILSTCRVTPGDSGGPLMDAEGRLLGVNLAISSPLRDDRFSYHVHVDEVRAFLATVPAEAAELPAQIPDAWRIGPCVLWEPGENATRVGLLRGQDMGSTNTVMFDFDGDSTMTSNDAESVARALAARGSAGFDMEMALHFTPTEKSAFYDTDHDGAFDLVLVDHDEDPLADTAFHLTQGRWSVELDCGLEWLQLSRVVDPGSRNKATYMRAARAVREVLR